MRAIKVEQLGKQYRIGALRESFPTLRDALTAAVRSPFESFRRARGNGQMIWALRDVNFEIAAGEVVGIIGRNGAGKSTLLKILSRITEPTTGRVELHGRLASLLEVGTGFHPELTGRENVFLNGAILGMPQVEIRKKFDEIIAFAELEKFVDTPVKRYSSGMYVRLAFAVAAYLESDVLIVDEVLAVGDVSFQRRCLGKMQDATRHGRTVIFVSHNMAAVKSLCNRAMLLQEGRVVSEGGVDAVVEAYLTDPSIPDEPGVVPDSAHSGSGEARVRKVELLDRADNALTQVYLGQPFRIAVTLDVNKNIEGALVGVGLSSTDGTRITSSYNIDGGRPPANLAAGRTYRILVDLDVTLLPRQYAIDVTVCRMNGADVDVTATVLKFDALAVAETGEDHYPWPTVHGFVRVASQWQVEEVPRDLPVSQVVA